MIALALPAHGHTQPPPPAIILLSSPLTALAAVATAAHGRVRRSISQTLSRIKSRGGVVYLLTVPGLTACKDARLFDASSCPSIPPLTFYKLLEIERPEYGYLHDWTPPLGL